MSFLKLMLRLTGGSFASALFAASIYITPVYAEDAAAPALWKLSDADSEIYLFGTVHMLDPNLSWHSAKVNSAFNEAETLILEAPVLDTPPEEMQRIVMKHAMNPAGTGLSSLLSEAGNRRLIEVLTSFNMSEAQAVATKQSFEPLRPWIVGLQLAAMQAQHQGADPSAGVDSILEDAAKRAGKSLKYLESVEQQIQVFAGLSQAKETQMLEESLSQMLEDPDLLNAMVRDWIKGDAASVGHTLQEALDDPELYAALLTNRNQNWARQIKTLMDGSGRYFIAVGTGHLVGKGSLQEFLALKGLTATRVQ